MGSLWRHGLESCWCLLDSGGVKEVFPVIHPVDECKEWNTINFAIAGVFAENLLSELAFQREQPVFQLLVENLYANNPLQN